MAYDRPAVLDVQTRYPAFASVSDATIDAYLTDALATAVDTSWPEAYYAPAAIAYAAHRMAGLGIGAHGQSAEFARQGVTGLRSGSFSVNLDPGKAQAASSGEFAGTPYGQEYARLLKAAKGGPRVIVTALAPGASGLLSRQNNGVPTWPY